MSAREYIQTHTNFSDAGMYKEGFGDDENNCCVRAIAIAFRLSYKESYGLAAAAGRPHGKGWYMYMIMDYMKKNGYNLRKIPLDKYPNVHQLLKQKREGRFIAVTKDHTFPIINGEIWDSEINRPRQYIKRLYKVIAKCRFP